MNRENGGERGYAMAALLVGMSVMAVLLSAAMPVWSTAAKRMKEDELVFRGEQYAHAIAMYQRKYANALPPSIDVLVNERFLRKKYLDPITGQEFQVLTGAVGQAAPGGSGGPAGQAGRGGTTGTGGGGSSELTGSGGGLGSGRSTSGSRGTSAQTSPLGRGSTGTGSTASSGRTGGFGGGIGGGIVGVASRSKEKSLRVYNGRDVYSEWAFVPVQRQIQAGGGDGSATPGAGRSGQQGQGSRGSTGSRGFGGSGADAFRPAPSGPGSGGGFRSGGPSSSSGR